jgi:hypothetical protein
VEKEVAEAERAKRHAAEIRVKELEVKMEKTLDMLRDSISEKEELERQTLLQSKEKAKSQEIIRELAGENHTLRSDVAESVLAFEKRLCPKANFWRAQKIKVAYVQHRREAGTSFAYDKEMVRTVLVDLAEDEEAYAEFCCALLTKGDVRQTVKAEPKAKGEKVVAGLELSSSSSSNSDSGSGSGSVTALPPRKGSGRSRAETNRDFREARAVALWCLQVESTSQSVSYLTKGISVNAVGLSQKAAAIGGVTGTAMPPRSRDKYNSQLIKAFEDLAEERIDLLCTTLVPPGMYATLWNWVDDFSCFYGKKMITKLGRQSMMHKFAMGAMRVCYHPKAKQAVRVAGKPASNPDGYSTSTNSDILSVTGCGTKTYRDFMEERIGDFGAKFGAGVGKFFTVNGISNLQSSLDYGQQPGLLKNRSKWIVTPYLCRVQDCHSVQEIIVMVAAIFTHKYAVRSVLERDEYMMLLGDHPVYMVSEHVRMQADTPTGCHPKRGRRHLGELVYYAHMGTKDGKIMPQVEQMDKTRKCLLEVVGLPLDCPRDDLYHHLGRLYSQVICINPGELHWMLNPCDDMVKPQAFRPWFESLFTHLYPGKQLPSKCTARLISSLAQVMSASFEKIRKPALQRIEDQLLHDAKEGLGANFTLVSLRWLLENTLLANQLHYDLLIRDGAVGTAETEADGDYHLVRKSHCFKAQHAMASLRKNYGVAGVKAQDTTRYWERTKHPLWENIYKHVPQMCDEWFGETIVNGSLRGVPRTMETASFRDRCVLDMCSTFGLDKNAMAVSLAFGFGRRVRKAGSLGEPNIEQMVRAGVVWMMDLINHALNDPRPTEVKQKGKKKSVEFEGVPHYTGAASALLAGSLGYQLHAQGKAAHFSPLNCPMSESNCQQQGCRGKRSREGGGVGRRRRLRPLP